MGRYDDRRILADITPYFLGAFFENKATKRADIDRFTRRKGLFNNLEKDSMMDRLVRLSRPVRLLTWLNTSCFFIDS
jgi:hypothetical protein